MYVEIANFPESEEVLVEMRPVIHAALVHVVRDVIDMRKARCRVPFCRIAMTWRA